MVSNAYQLKFVIIMSKLRNIIPKSNIKRTKLLCTAGNKSFGINIKRKIMKQFIIIGLILIGFANCYSQPNAILEETVYNSKSPALNNIMENFELLSKEVDNTYKNNSTKIELYLQLDKKGLIKLVPDFKDVPESFYASYNLIRNKKGQIIYIAEYPRSESDDWYLIYENYFDNKGNLVAFIRKCSFFNGECAEIVHEKSDYYYDSNHKLINKTYEITDGDLKSLDYKKCIFYYRYDYKQYMTLKDYLKIYKFDE